MIRRPPTIITLGDEELQYHLHRIFLRTLSADFDHLCLDDHDNEYQGHTGDTRPDSSPPSSTPSPSDSEQEVNVNPNRDEPRGSSCIGNRSEPSLFVMAPTSPSEKSVSLIVAKSAHPTVDTSKDSITPRLASCLLPYSQDQEQEQQPRRRVTWAALPHDHQKVKGTIRHPLGNEENRPQSLCPDAWTTTNDAEHSRLPTSQISRESPAALPEMTIDIVPPPRDLILVSTRFDEVGVATVTVDT
ncbi:hypothetical protein N7478_009808 [Penicillium angulare]|uniref:uncharacterized protein n=1 Tax=Penicillium angulare TaxID=116970 RepID=UPI0025405A9E|nr:uncharacterized protein N7478_009808 [Penicillium angulare]KAJ5267000.1 hypothetical protein N7478_009808 [Penicillium angulare]